MLGTEENEQTSRCYRILEEVLLGTFGRATSEMEASFLDEFHAVNGSKEQISDQLDHLKISLSAELYHLAKALIRALVILRNRDELLDHDELNRNRLNLVEEYGSSAEVAQMLYQMYIDCFPDAFTCAFGLADLGTLLSAVDDEELWSPAECKRVLGPLEPHLQRFIRQTIDRTRKIVSFLKVHYDFENFLSSYGFPGEPRLGVQNRELSSDLNWHAVVPYAYFVLCRDLVPYMTLYGLWDCLDIANRRLPALEVELLKTKSPEEASPLVSEEDRYHVKDLKDVRTGEEFELYLQWMFQRLGYLVELTQKGGDQGADLILVKGKRRAVVQAKLHTRPVGNHAVQEVLGAIAFYDADKGLIVTNSHFTKHASELARRSGIVLVDGQRLKILFESILARERLSAELLF